MDTNFDRQVKELKEQVARLVRIFSDPNVDATKFKITLPKGFEEKFFNLIDKVNFSLMEEQENFYGYFLFQMEREIRFDISSPTGVNFKAAKYVIYFNPFIFLNLNRKQMQSTIKHEILHILSFHLVRAKKAKETYSTLAINMAMDLVVNKYLDHLPPYATTLEWVNMRYSLTLKSYAPFEYYVKNLQAAMDLQKEAEDSNINQELVETEFDASRTHDIWEESSVIEENVLQEFTEKIISASQKGDTPTYLENLIESLKNQKEHLPWHLYLKRLIGTVESSKKKTITRRNRRQPERLDLRGKLRKHKAKIAVAVDTSASMSEEEFKLAIVEILNIVKNYGHEITIIECDDAVRRVYQIKSEREIKNRKNTKGNTQFTPVFEYVNHKKFDLLIYFTDGKGEERLKVIPKGYKILWVLLGDETLSLRNSYGIVKRQKRRKKEDSILDMNDVERGGYSMNNQERIL